MRTWVWTLALVGAGVLPGSAACRAVPELTFDDSIDEAGPGEGGGPDGATDSGPLDGGGPTTDAGAATAVRRIRCGVPAGAPPYTDSQGQVWSGDRDFDVGMVVGNNDPIQGTNDPVLYRSERFADRNAFPSGFKYTFGGIASGPYLVRLHFAETTSAPIVAAGQRRFNVVIDGAPVLMNLDIFAEAGGRDRALVKVFPVTVSGSSLVVQFTPGAVQNPKVNAIEVLKGP